MTELQLLPKRKAPATVKARPWITEETIRLLRVDGSKERIPDGDKAAEGFGVRRRAGKKGVELFFNFTARLKTGKTSNIALGTVGVMSLDEGRTIARKLRRWVDAGKDPRLMLAEEQAANRISEATAVEAEAMTLGHAIKLKLESPDLREGTKKQYSSLISTKSKVSLSKLVSRRLDSIGRAEWRTILNKVRAVYGEKSPQPAVVRRAVAALYRNAVSESDHLKLDNPIAELRRAEFADPKNRRTGHLEAKDVKGWFRQLNNHNADMANLAKLYLLTGMRDKEARHLRWDEVEPACIRIPPERIKTNVELLVPRTPAIDVLLEAQGRYKGRSPYVFPALLSRPGEAPGERLQRPLSSILPMLKGLGLSVHDMRRSAATFMDQLGVPENIRRHLLNHSPDISRGYVVRDLATMGEWLTKYHQWLGSLAAPDSEGDVEYWDAQAAYAATPEGLADSKRDAEDEQRTEAEIAAHWKERMGV